MKLYSQEDELSKEAELIYWTVQERVRLATTDQDHDTMFKIASFVLSEDDPDVIKYRDVLRKMDLLDDEISRVEGE